MGASNAIAVCTHWTALPGDAFKVLTFMALITMDRDPEPTYWGDTEPLVRAIGRKSEPVEEADYRALRRAIRVLVENRAISVDKRAGPGHPPHYRLHLTPVTF